MKETVDPEIYTRIASYEMAYRMQTSGKELIDFSKETAQTIQMYGAEPGKATFANNCLLARRLVERGGMLFIDDHNHDVGGVFHNTAIEEITRTFSPPKALPNDHQIYRSFFKFSDGPPTTSHELNGWGDNLVHKNLQAVMQGDRIGVLYSSKDYSSEWNYHPDSKRFSTIDNTRFGVNIIVYALTR